MMIPDLEKSAQLPNHILSIKVKEVLLTLVGRKIAGNKYYMSILITDNLNIDHYFALTTN